MEKWKISHSLAIHSDVLTPLKVISLGFQKEKHDPTKAVRCIKEFTWTIAKLQLLIDASLDCDNGGRLAHLTKLFKEVDENSMHPEVKLVNFEIHKSLLVHLTKRLPPHLLKKWKIGLK